jgi:hypothetical protein
MLADYPLEVTLNCQVDQAWATPPPTEAHEQADEHDDGKVESKPATYDNEPES